MRKKLMSKLSVRRETLAALDSASLAQLDLRLVAGGTARTACGSCPALSCEGSRCCGPTG
jgi:hypothetical protein